MNVLENSIVLISLLSAILVVLTLLIRIRSVIFLLPAWFSPHSKIRVFFHKLRGVRIGKFVEIGYYVTIDNELPNFITLKDNVTITNNCVLLAHDHSNTYTNQNKKDKIAPIVVEEFAFVGCSSIILPGVKIGRRAIVGAGSVVTKNVGPEEVVVGNPARNLK